MHRYAKIAIFWTLILFNTSVFASDSYLLKAISLDNIRVTKIYSTFSNAFNYRLSEANKYFTDTSRVELENLSRQIEQKFVLLADQVKQQDRADGILTVNEIKQLASQSTDIIRLAKTNTNSNTTTTTNVISSVVAPASSVSKPVDVLYYADNFEGAGTSGGDKFSQRIFSSANCDVPFNTLTQVIFWENSVIVKNNDRPNCRIHPDIIDISTIAFKTLAPISRGRIKGDYYTLWSIPANFSKKYLETKFFESLHIILDENIPNIYLVNETLHISWKVTDGKELAIISLEIPGWKQIWYLASVQWGEFDYNIPLEIAGRYKLVVASGNSFEKATATEFIVLDPSVFSGKKYISASYKDIDSLVISHEDGTSTNVIDLPKWEFHEALFRQNGKEIKFVWMGNIAIPLQTFRDFDRTKSVEVTVSASKTSTAFSHDTFTYPGIIYQKNVLLTESHKITQDENLSAIFEWSELVIRWIIKEWSQVGSNIYVILPNGKVRTYKFEPEYLQSGTQIIKTNTLLEARIPVSEEWQYIVEINYETWFAALNIPVLRGSVLPLLPNLSDAIEKSAIVSMTSQEAQKKSLTMLNDFRTSLGMSKLETSITLTKLAMIKAQDMADNNYIGHVDSSGTRILGTAKRNKIEISGSIGENVAGGEINMEKLFAELQMSAGHRANMLDTWTWVGFWYAEKNGQVYYVQVFGE